ncbi:MAG TPA: oxidoreductase [Chitinophagales bacterium]|nr:oxidoreductase [Chitinophagales bacterium]
MHYGGFIGATLYSSYVSIGNYYFYSRMEKTKTALVLGATGLTGRQCLDLLLESEQYAKVIALVRTAPELQNDKLQSLVVDFNRLDDYASQIAADDIYCCIGTTIGKAGSQGAFRHVDFEIPLKVAEIAKANGATKFILVSSVGADSRSLVFYSRVKGELESALKKLKYPSLLIFRPSILLGNRKEKRAGEAIGRYVAQKMPFIFSGALRKYRGTPVNLLAQAMLAEATEPAQGTRVIENDEIFTIAGNQ